MEQENTKPPTSPGSPGVNKLKNYYDTLNVAPTASIKEIRESYFRLRNTYSNNNQALYSLICENEVSEALGKIEEAYAILSKNSERQHYDSSRQADPVDCGPEPGSSHSPASSPLAASAASSPAAQVRDQPLSSLSSSDPAAFPLTSRRGASGSESPIGLGRSASSLAETGPSFPAQAGYLASPRRVIARKAHCQDIQAQIHAIIADGDLGNGHLFRRIRQAVGIDKVEMQEHTKISVGYIDHLEDNRFDLLPQPVYVKGFLRSYLRYLGVTTDCDRLVKAYIERYAAWVESKNT